MTEQQQSETPRLHDYLSVACGAGGALVSATLFEIDGVGLLLAVSAGLNVMLFVWAYTLWEGWHQLDEPEGITG